MSKKAISKTIYGKTVETAVFLTLQGIITITQRI